MPPFLVPFLLAALVAVALGGFTLWQRQRFARALAQMEARRLGVQLNPHFLFNTLNGISELGYEDPEAADRAITRLSGLLRRSLEDSSRPEISLKAEFDFLEDYLALQRMLLRDPFEAVLELDPGCERARVPAMILQPLVENALTHGRSGRLEVVARRDGRLLRLSVRDYGPGPCRSEGRLRDSRPGIGLANTRARLEALCGPAAEVALEAAEGGGACSRIALPFRELP